MLDKLNLPLAGSVLAFLLATSCCRLPILAASLFGTAVGSAIFSEKMEPFSGILMAIGAALAGYTGWRFYRKSKTKTNGKILLQSKITCPKCGFSKEETMPTNACQFFYECENCKVMLKPLAGDCCVFCSYGMVKCPPIQSGGGSCC